MEESHYLKIEAALSNDEMAMMDQWASHTARGIRKSDVILSATYIVLKKLWHHFDPDLVDAWCTALVKRKITGRTEDE